jgi:YVTN family beta-propeller protein
VNFPYLFRITANAIVCAGLTASISSSHPFQDTAASANHQVLPNVEQKLTPLAPKNARFERLNPGLADFPDYVAGQAVTTVVSPDKSTLLVLTSGYNLLNTTAAGANQGNKIAADSTEYVFVYNIISPNPVQTQVIQIPNTYNGIVFDPSGTTFYVSGGVNDNVHIYDLVSGLWAERTGSPIPLGHTAGVGLEVSPEAAGIAITADGSKLVVADYYNDSISILTKSSNTWAKAGELDLRPGKIDPSKSGVPGGEYPYWVAAKGTSTAYISSIRDREIVVVDISSSTPTVTKRIKVKGQPNKMVLNGAQSTLFVAEDETDSVATIDTASNTLTSEFGVGAPPGLLPSTRANLTGNNTNSVALSPDEKTLYVTNGNTNNVAVVNISAQTVTGLIPTGWYPNSVSLNGDGSYMYVVNGKSPTGANPGDCHGSVMPGKSSAECAASNQYDLQLIKAGFQSFPTPTANQLVSLSQQVASNNNYTRLESASELATMAAIRSKIKHVIYIIKENRTYDQILGDLYQGNGDPSLTEFGLEITPNLHALASGFVTLDNFYDRSEVSMDGWPWTTSARAPDVVERQVTVNYAGRGLSNDSEGTNRNVNVSYSTQAERETANPLTPSDPDVFPGTTSVAAPDGPDNEVNTGYIWNAALRAGLTVRDYGFFIDLARYNLPAANAQYGIPEVTDPYSAGIQVAYSTDTALRPYTDPYFRGFDNSFPDYYRFTEWQREFTSTYAGSGLPALSLVRLMHDHTGNFSTALNGLNTPEIQEADNDYAVGLLVQTVAHSQYKDNTLIFVIEDDSQDGGDHVDAHRSIAFIVGPYVKEGALISKSYNTVDFLRTIEEVLGVPPLNLNDSLAIPMANVFDVNHKKWDYNATASTLLVGHDIPLPAGVTSAKLVKPTHDAAYWTKATEGMDFSAEDRFNFDQYNRILWKGLMGNRPYPEVRSGLDLRQNRTELLKKYRESQQSNAQADNQPTPAGSTPPGGF